MLEKREKQTLVFQLFYFFLSQINLFVAICIYFHSSQPKLPILSHVVSYISVLGQTERFSESNWEKTKYQTTYTEFILVRTKQLFHITSVLGSLGKFRLYPFSTVGTVLVCYWKHILSSLFYKTETSMKRIFIFVGNIKILNDTPH